MVIKMTMTLVILGIMINYIRHVSPTVVPVILVMLSAIVMLILFKYINSSGLIPLVKSLMNDVNSSNKPLFVIVLKVIGIAWVVNLGVQLCTDMGETFIATKIELVGKVILTLYACQVLLVLYSMLKNIIDLEI